MKKTNTIVNREEIINSLIERVDNLLEIDVNDLSNNELAFIKNVSLSSIMSMKKKRYTNEQILTTNRNTSRNFETTVKSTIANMSDEELSEKYGLKRV